MLVACGKHTSRNLQSLVLEQAPSGSTAPDEEDDDELLDEEKPDDEEDELELDGKPDDEGSPDDELLEDDDEVWSGGRPLLPPTSPDEEPDELEVEPGSPEEPPSSVASMTVRMSDGASEPHAIIARSELARRTSAMRRTMAGLSYAQLAELQPNRRKYA